MGSAGSGELDENGCHVVSADAGLRILCKDLVEHFADDDGRLLIFLLFDLVSNEVAAFLVGEAVPDAIAGVHDELIIRSARNNTQVRRCWGRLRPWAHSC